ncbi:MAG TPA: extracellular solute-binding protein [Anaerolineaceae bacterium]|nr:extracellular solute-binding protein [Anaerolineaceae bacterium]
MSKKFLPLISILLILSFALAACSPKTTEAPVVEEPVAEEPAPETEAPVAEETEVAAPAEEELTGTVTIWHSKKNEETNSLNAIVIAFKEKYPGVEFEQLFVPADDLRNKFETAVATGSGPTMIIGNADWGPASYDAMLVQDLTPMMTPGLMDTLNDAAANSVRYKDAIVGLPINLKGVLLFRNKSIVPEPAADWNDLIAKATAATSGDVQGMVFETGFFFAAGHMYALGADLMDTTSGVPTFNNEAGVAWLTALKNVKDAGIPTVNNSDDDVNLFKVGKAGMIIDGLWNVKALTDAIGAENLVIDPWPAGMSGYVQNDNIYLTTSAAGDDALATYKFMEFFVSPEAQAFWASAGTPELPMAAGIPVVKGMEVTDPLAKQAIACFAGGTAFPVIPQMGVYWDPMNNAILSVLDKGTDPAVALQEAFDSVSGAVK